MCSSRDAAFSLVELLVAMTVMAVVGAIAASCLFAVMHAWERSSAGGRASTRECAESMRSDFSRAIAARGIGGDSAACEFWIRATPPRVVRYRFDPRAGAVARETAPEPGADAVSSQTWRGVGGFSFAFGAAGNDGGIEWRDSSSMASPSPAFVKVVADGLPERIFLEGGLR